MRSQPTATDSAREQPRLTRRGGAQAGRLPDVIVACVGGGSNAIGLFHPFIGDKDVKIVGVEAGGEKVEREGGGEGER